MLHLEIVNDRLRWLNVVKTTLPICLKERP
jgi:hypothetical protein